MKPTFPTNLIYATAICVGILALAVIDRTSEEGAAPMAENEPSIVMPVSALGSGPETTELAVPEQPLAETASVAAASEELDLSSAMEVFGQAVAAGDHDLTSRDLKDIETLMGNLAIQLDNERADAARN